MKSNNKEMQYLKAKEKVARLKSFYTSLLSYVFFITLLAALNYYLDQWRNPWFLWPALAWGIGLFFQGMRVYGGFPFLGKKWEERKTQEFMEDDNL